MVATPQRMAQWLSDIEAVKKNPEAYFAYNEAEVNQYNDRLAKPPDNTS